MAETLRALCVSDEALPRREQTDITTAAAQSATQKSRDRRRCQTVADEHEQELPAHEESEEDDELISLVQQLEEVEEAAGDAR